MKQTEIRRIENRLERRAVIGAIVSDQFLREIAAVYDPRYIEAAYARLLVGWCIEYYKKYGSAPGKHIQDLYTAKRRTDEIDDTAADSITDLLEGMSKEWEQTSSLNAPYLVEQTLNHFKLRSLAILRDALSDSLDAGDASAGTAAVAGFRPVNRPTVDGFDPYSDVDAIIDAFEYAPEPLISFPGAAGRFLNSQLYRGAFVGVLGTFKRGKSWMLQEFSHRAAAARRNVAFFEVGDMSKDDVTLRTHIRLAGKSNDMEYCGDLYVPVLDCKHNQKGTCPFDREGSNPPAPPEPKQWDGDPSKRVDWSACTYKPCSRCSRGQNLHEYRGDVWWRPHYIPEPLQWREGYRLGIKFRKYGAGRFFRSVVTPAKTTTVRDIRATLDMWEAFEGFIPDVIVIDYADLLAAEDTRKEVRHQHNEIWMALRALSLERHALTITATQADADAMDKMLLDEGNFSEDVRKYAHVTAMITLNQTEQEKKMGLLRLGSFFVRRGRFSKTKTVSILQRIEMGQPCLASF